MYQIEDISMKLFNETKKKWKSASSKIDAIVCNIFLLFFSNVCNVFCFFASLVLNFLYTVAAPLIAAASNQKIFSGQLDAALIQERPLIKR